MPLCRSRKKSTYRLVRIIANNVTDLSQSFSKRIVSRVLPIIVVVIDVELDVALLRIVKIETSRAMSDVLQERILSPTIWSGNTSFCVPSSKFPVSLLTVKTYNEYPTTLDFNGKFVDATTPGTRSSYAMQTLLPNFCNVTCIIARAQCSAKLGNSISDYQYNFDFNAGSSIPRWSLLDLLFTWPAASAFLLPDERTNTKIYHPRSLDIRARETKRRSGSFVTLKVE